MPGVPNIGEGLVRTHDLLEVLRSDVTKAYAELEEDRQSQFKRRCVARAVFSFIEAAVECIKVEVRSTVRRQDCEAQLSEAERETLETLALVGPRPSKFLPLDQNIKRTFKLAAKLWGLRFQLSTDGEAFRCFRAAKSARDVLAHPRRYYDVEVTDLDMYNYSVTYEWFWREFHRLFQGRVESLMDGLSSEDAAAMRQLLTEPRSDA